MPSETKYPNFIMISEYNKEPTDDPWVRNSWRERVTYRIYILNDGGAYEKFLTLDGAYYDEGAYLCEYLNKGGLEDGYMQYLDEMITKHTFYDEDDYDIMEDTNADH